MLIPVSLILIYLQNSNIKYYWKFLNKLILDFIKVPSSKFQWYLMQKFFLINIIVNNLNINNIIFHQFT